MERAVFSPHPGECSLVKLVMITLLIPILAALVAALIFPERRTAAVAEPAALLSYHDPD
jgi:hypothetical protein